MMMMMWMWISISLGLQAGEAPLALRATSLKDARIENVSKKAQYVLHENRMQPSLLRLYRPDGTVVKAFDERSIEKFDITVTQEMYQSVEPGKTLKLFEARIQKRDTAGPNATYDLHWGPLTFRGLEAGQYTGVIDWTSFRNEYSNEKRRANLLRGVWMGTIRSEKFPVKVP